MESQEHVERVIARYMSLYRALYQRTPRELRDLGNGWLLVNGARMRVDELEALADQLDCEYQQFRINRRGIVKKLLTWFAKA